MNFDYHMESNRKMTFALSLSLSHLDCAQNKTGKNNGMKKRPTNVTNYWIIVFFLSIVIYCMDFDSFFTIVLAFVSLEPMHLG